ncbi:hypothetical protein LGH70_02830 [Hymenobacter sp. BT635]|uniref:KAP NTPase domain-containing protein n=1 Tax=Hymenobacter nitidus TaxID=2880929 RepID=A0ABS8A7W5_9BACT|nr:P-loop NTPase fold protein [Hymenobacter nitidus]MCB2376498.1 hypothetical protein [Hymenobacter nitidus]
MKSIPLYQAEPPLLPTWLYYLAAALLAWTIYVLWLSFKLGQLRRASERQHRNAANKTATESAAGQPDQPSDIDELQLGVAPVLVGLLTHPLTNEPYTIALSGGWGSGKSSVMRQIEKQLRQRRVSFKSVHINVWHFQQEDQLLTEFLRRILNKCDTFWFRFRQVRHNLSHLGFGRTLYRATMLALVLPALLLLAWVLLRDAAQYISANQILNSYSDVGHRVLQDFRTSDLGLWLAKVFKAPFYVIRHLRQALSDTEVKAPGLLAIVTLAGSVLASLYKLPELLRPLVQLIPYQQQYEVAQGQASFRQRYQDDFSNIIRHAKNETLIIFVDDIDRISGARVLELLETLNFIVTSAQDRRGGGALGAKLYFVLAMNVPEVVRVLGPVLDTQQHLKPEAAQQLAANYLSKLVDLTVNIPSLQGRDISSLYVLKPAAQAASV